MALYKAYLFAKVHVGAHGEAELVEQVLEVRGVDFGAAPLFLHVVGELHVRVQQHHALPPRTAHIVYVCWRGSHAPKYLFLLSTPHYLNSVLIRYILPFTGLGTP